MSTPDHAEKGRTEPGLMRSFRFAFSPEQRLQNQAVGNVAAVKKLFNLEVNSDRFVIFNGKKIGILVRNSAGFLVCIRPRANERVPEGVSYKHALIIATFQPNLIGDKERGRITVGSMFRSIASLSEFQPKGLLSYQVVRCPEGFDFAQADYGDLNGLEVLERSGQA